MTSSPKPLPRTGFRMSSFGGSNGVGIEDPQGDGQAEAHRGATGDPTPAAGQQPAVREDERDGDGPGEEQGQGRTLRLVRPGRADGLLGAQLEGRQKRAEQEDPGDEVAGQLECDQQADDRRGEERKRQERIDAERNPVFLLRRDHLQDVQEADRQRCGRRKCNGTGEDPKPTHPGILCLREPNCNRRWHRDPSRYGR